MNDLIKFGVKPVIMADGTTYHDNNAFWTGLKKMTFEEATSYLKNISVYYPDWRSIIEPSNE
jgi:hypothetical protein